MQFGMALLLVVILCSVAGSLIVQQRSAMEYVTRYGEKQADLILSLGLDHVFSTPWFIAVMILLCLNLTLCSIVRLPKTVRQAKALLHRAGQAAATHTLTDKQHDKLTAFLKQRGFSARQSGESTVYYKHLFGFYGSFLTHLSFLLLLIVGALVMVTATVTDTTVMPGDTITLEDGTLLTVNAFRIEDETGLLDYTSLLTLTNPNTQRTLSREIRVNEPMSFGPYKVYQQTYGTAGKVLIENLENGAAEEIFLTESCFLTLNGVDGLFYQALYPGYVQEEDGTVTLITSSSHAYHDPVYDVLSVAEGTMTPVLAFPEDELTLGNVRFTFMEPAAYPGLRIKTIHSELLYALYAVFALMVIGLALCFFAVPTAITVTEQGYALHSSKPQTGLMIDIEACLTQEEN